MSVRASSEAWRWAVALAVAWLVAGCGKSTSNSGGPISLSQLVTRAVDIFCEGRAKCCKSSGIGFDVAACKQALGAELEQEFSELSPNVVYDADAAGECLESIAASSRCGELDDDDAPACERVFQGTLALGAPCSDGEECREAPGQNVGCASPDGLQPEVCTLFGTYGPSPHGKLGDACDSTCDGDGCAVAPAPSGPGVEPETRAVCYRNEGLYCDYPGRTCAKLVALGGACADYDACAPGAFCDMSSGTCSAPRSTGSACEGDNQCRSENCRYGDVGGTCVAVDSLSAEECALPSEELADPPPSGTPP